MNFSTNKEKDKIDMYMIPKEAIKNRSTLNLCDKYEKYKVK